MTQDDVRAKAREVIQADRDAAADFYGPHLARPGEVLVTAHMRAGKIDESPLILAFAAHRLAFAPRQGDRSPEPSFQDKVQPWLMACFGAMIAGDRVERNHRFLEEALELVQACGCAASEAHQLVDYVYGRAVGELHQEVGGVMVTLAALCLANDADMHAAGWVELDRIWGKVEAIRAKQAAKPKHSPLPEAPTVSQTGEG